MPKHSHKCTCEHDRVEFCKTCKIVHCLDCNQEWTAKSTWANYPWYGQTYQTITGNPNVSTVGSTLGIYNSGRATQTLASDLESNQKYLDPTPTLTCSAHKKD